MGRSGSSYQLMRIAGIRIGVDASWFLILFLAIYFLQDAYKDEVSGSETTAYVAAVATAFLFFGSIVLHELGHALAARREGIHVAGIDLFFFGGLMRMSSDTSSPGAEFRVAAAGPLVTLLIVLFGTVLGGLLEGWDRFWEVSGWANDDRVSAPLMAISWIVRINIVLFVFNLVPAFPLDGGRMARAAVWKATGDRAKATRVSAGLGQAFGWLLIGLGLYIAFVGDDAFNGIYLAVLGWLLGQAARGAVVQSAVTERLEGITVADVMDAEPVTIPAALSARQAYDDYFLRYHGWDWFAVVDGDGRYVGRVQRAAVQEASESERTVGELTPADAEGRVREDATLEALLGSEPLRRLGSLMAVDAEGRLRGVVTLEQVSRALRSRLAPG
jgi:Zn-dependent protease